ncbi:MAG: citrate/2-methylcitrate synthase [Ruminococcaceae bacterium]|nr:citrate/2-methylcitrate synthase [Oscillospiraceae bacterium]
MHTYIENVSADKFKKLCDELKIYSSVAPEYFDRFEVKRGLRNRDGSGVMAGLTKVCAVEGYYIDDGERKPVEGHLTYRGIDINDLVDGCIKENRFGYEEVVWLLLFGHLPTRSQLEDFNKLLSDSRELPEDFIEDMIMKAPSPNIMNKLERSVLSLYSYDSNPDDISIENVLRQSVQLVAQLPTIMTYAYQVKRRYYLKKSMYLHPIKPGLSTAETILYNTRSNRQFTDEEAKLLDLCLMIHAEHGGGNNSAFATRVLTSSGTDTYAAISAGIGSLKGPRHGGANLKVAEMMNFLKADVTDITDEGQVADFLKKIINREAGDKSGLVYGMGHAVYTLSDPRQVILKREALKLAEEKGFGDEFKALDLIEKLTPEIFASEKHNNKKICANVDLYSGLIYQMLGIPEDLYTPLFAIARVAGWSAHRIEELISGNRVIRPAYKNMAVPKEYAPIDERISDFKKSSEYVPIDER